MPRSHSLSLVLVASALALGAPPAAAQTARIRGLPATLVADSGGVERMLDSLPLRARVAQLVMPWIPGGYAAADDSAFTIAQRWVDSLGVGGIIVSVGSPLDIAARLNRLQARARLPLLVASDLESGSSFRLSGGTPFPSNMGIAATGREEDAYEVGRVTALEGRAVGIHLTFSPVADVNNNPENPIINTRSYGEDAAAVARLVAATVRGIQDHGMLATAKHFPGHGDTGTDSHITVPVIGVGWARLDSVELVPFRAAIAAGVSSVMSGHLALPKLAGPDGRPATLDPAVLTGILRDSLHFQGLVVTDALDMGAIVEAYGPGEAAVLAFLAGSDLLLMPTDPARAIDAVTDAVETGRITYERLERSVRRVLLLKWHLGLLAERTVRLDSIPERVGSARFVTVARDIATRSIVLAADSGGAVDSLRSAPRRVALVTYGEENAGTVGNGLARQLRLAGHTVTLFRLWPASGPASLDSARALIRKTPYTVFAVAVRHRENKGTVAIPEPVAKLIDQGSRRRRTAVVALGSPYIASQLPHMRSYLLGWSANAVSEWAAGRALAGFAPITGRLPVRLPPDFGIGHGLWR